jgi:hypothetical protein
MVEGTDHVNDAAKKECEDRLAELGEAKVRLMHADHAFPTAWHAHVVEWLSAKQKDAKPAP